MKTKEEFVLSEKKVKMYSTNNENVKSGSYEVYFEEDVKKFIEIIKK
jgi:hypothetical protein